MSEWHYATPPGEPPFWWREAGPHEIDGVDPITGHVIAHTEAERIRLTGNGPS